jgi:copper oxidase (laccase) domain-containing protein
VGPTEGGTVIPDTDALITDAPGLALLLRFADCAPVLLYDPVRGAVGWRMPVGAARPAAWLPRR